MKELEEGGWVEGVDVVGGTRTGFRTRTLNDDDGALRSAGAKGGDNLFAWNVMDGGVENNAVDVGKTFEGFEGLRSAVSGNDVEFSGLDDELARGDGARVFAVDDEEAGADHEWIVRGDVGAVL